MTVSTLLNTHSSLIAGSPCHPTITCNVCIQTSPYPFFADDYENAQERSHVPYREVKKFNEYALKDSDIPLQTTPDKHRFHLDHPYVLLTPTGQFETTLYTVERTGITRALQTRDYTRIQAHLVRYVRVFESATLLSELFKERATVLSRYVECLPMEILCIIAGYEFTIDPSSKGAKTVLSTAHIAITRMLAASASEDGPAKHPLLALKGGEIVPQAQ